MSTATVPKKVQCAFCSSSFSALVFSLCVCVCAGQQQGPRNWVRLSDMVGYLTLSTLPRKEKEKTMLLLAAADDKAWCVIHDAQHRFCIEWQVSSTHPALSFLPLKSVPSVHT
ncbi:putative glucosamine-6-phosphate isomerase, putative,glucosamine-6-phosphate deaminase, partial [Trypanosoma grayi]|uniref:putative glucosamine-6-phosphate isomerase, putative,glucosamine-6-phosphate deaminase n=1 Tax=Trypanosoma grayi TaxID=71804 RepID=UPI0004F3F0E8